MVMELSDIPEILAANPLTVAQHGEGLVVSAGVGFCALICDQMSHTVTANSFKKTFNFHLFMI